LTVSAIALWGFGLEIGIFGNNDMFTGIIEMVGQVRSFQRLGAGGKITVDLKSLAEGVALGDSVAINGVCLTASAIKATAVEFDVSGETLGKTGIGKLTAGANVNLERAMPANGRFGGHIVQGHVDGTASIRSIDRKGDFYDVWFSASGELLDEMVAKGSVAIDGISLTVAEMDDKGFKVAIIPTTWNETTLGAAKVADTVNIETDIVIKTIKKQLSNILPSGGGGLDANKLRESGF
jgi:riboflavin synthase